MQENAVENVVCKIKAYLSSSQCVKEIEDIVFVTVAGYAESLEYNTW